MQLTLVLVAAQRSFYVVICLVKYQKTNKTGGSLSEALSVKATLLLSIAYTEYLEQVIGGIFLPASLPTVLTTSRGNYHLTVRPIGSGKPSDSSLGTICALPLFDR